MTMVVFAGLLVGALLVASLGAVGGGKVGDSCTTPNLTAGKCTPINKCPPLLSLVNMVKLNAQSDKPALLDYLKRSSCGTFEKSTPVVCCEHVNLPLINRPGCGDATVSRIVGGKTVSLAEFPWMALLYYKRGARGLSADCGGTLITPKYVLTAAHCIETSLTQVRLGEHDVRTDPDCEILVPGEEDCSDPVQNLPVKRFIKHPRYSRKTLVNDIALIELRTAASITVSGYVKTICLPTNHTNTENKNLTIAGWGVTENHTASEVLLKANVPTISLNDCRAMFLKKGVSVSLSDAQICAGGNNIADSCSGDSGGPLKGFEEGSTIYTQYGVVSFGARKCATLGLPAVYTAVEKYLPWILDNITP